MIREMPATTSRFISVVIPSVSGSQQLIELVDRLAPGPRLEVVIADNGLDPSVVERLRSSSARVIPMGANFGFGAAVNRAVARTEGDALVLLNDDLGADRRFVERLCGRLETADIAAGVLAMAEDPDVIETAGIVFDRNLDCHDYLAGQRVAQLGPSVPSPVGPNGGAAAFRREAFAAVGGFDEGFFAYGEDADLAIRLFAAGARCALAHDAVALHPGSDTSGGYQSLRKAIMVGDSRGYYYRKYGIARRPAALIVVGAIEVGASLVLARRHRSLEPLRARARGFRRCKVEGPQPPASIATVNVLEGMRRRYRRSFRHRSRDRRPGSRQDPLRA